MMTWCIFQPCNHCIRVGWSDHLALFLFLIGMLLFLVLDFLLVDFWFLKMAIDMTSFWMTLLNLRNVILVMIVK